MQTAAKFTSRFALIASAALGLNLMTGCDKGPVENAGAKVDRGIDKVKDAVTGAGPVEKAGRAVDRATGGR